MWEKLRMSLSARGMGYLSIAALIPAIPTFAFIGALRNRTFSVNKIKRTLTFYNRNLKTKKLLTWPGYISR
jgi:uncharacterized membrane protein (GlpM family)